MSKGSHDGIQWNMYAGVRAAEGLLSLFTLSPRNIQGKQDWNEKQWRAAFACWMSSLSSRAIAVGGQLGHAVSWGVAEISVATPGCTQGLPRCRAAQSPLHLQPGHSVALSTIFGEGRGMQAVPDREEEVQGCWSSLLICWKVITKTSAWIHRIKQWPMSNNKLQLGRFELDTRKNFSWGRWSRTGSTSGYPGCHGISVLGGFQGLARQSLGWPDLLSAIVLLWGEGWTGDFQRLLPTSISVILWYPVWNFLKIMSLKIESLELASLHYKSLVLISLLLVSFFICTAKSHHAPWQGLSASTLTWRVSWWRNICKTKGMGLSFVVIASPSASAFSGQ